MKRPLSCVIIDDVNIIKEYIDDYLYKKLARDGSDKLSDFISGGFHLGFYNDSRLIGVISFGFDGYDAVIHPKFRVGHMIYAKRCCMESLDYLKGMGVHRVFALIPETFKANQKMAVSCGLEKTGIEQDSIYIDKKAVTVLAYSICLSGVFKCQL